MAKVDLSKLAEIQEPQAPAATAPDKDLAPYLAETDLEIKKEELEGLKQDRNEREKYADKIFGLISRWLYGIMALIILCSLNKAVPCFYLSDNVILGIIGGTTVTVIGLFVIVAKYLFYRK